MDEAHKGSIVVITPQSREKLKFLVRLAHANLDREELSNIECTIADLLTEHYEESVASVSTLQVSALTGLPNGRQLMTYRSERWPLRIMVSGLSLLSSATNSEEFLKHISDSVISLLIEKAIAPIDSATDICVCAVGGTGDVIPGKAYAVPNQVIGSWPLIEGRRRGLLLAVPGGGDADLIAINVPEAITLPPNETEIALGNNTDWHKQITGWTFCKDRTLTIEAPPNAVEPLVSMRLRRAECEFGEADTIIFRKPKFLGVWTDMYHWVTSSQFWELHGGRRISYVWCWHGTGRADWSCGGFTS